MKMFLFAVRDLRAQVYLDPYVSRTDTAAHHSFGVACRDPGTVMFHQPEDFELHLIGTFDTQTGDVVAAGDDHIYRGVDAKGDGNAS